LVKLLGVLEEWRWQSKQWRVENFIHRLKFKTSLYKPNKFLSEVLIWNLVLHNLDQIILIGVSFASLIKFGSNDIFNFASILVKDSIHIINCKHLIGVIFIEQEQSHPKPIRAEYVSLALMERKVSFIDLELTWLSCHLVVFNPPVSDLGQLVQLDKELTKHLFLDWLLVSF